MSIEHGEQQSFSTHEWMFLKKCQGFQPRGELKLKPWIHAERSTIFELPGPDICYMVFYNSGSRGIDFSLKS